MNGVYTFSLIGTSALLAAITLPGYEQDDDRDLTTPLVIVSVALMVVQWGLSNVTRISLWRIIPCPHKSVSTGQIVVSKALRALMIAVLIILVFQLPAPTSNDNSSASYIL